MATATLVLGGGFVGEFVSQADAAVPFAVLLRHPSPEGVGLCAPLVVPWVSTGTPHPVWTLRTLRPLTLAEIVTCPACGTSGRITADQWVPV